MNIGNIIAILILIILNAFFVSVEFAAVTSRRARLDLMVGDQDSQSARLVRQWLEQPAARDRLIAASQFGITLVSLALGAVGENAFAVWLEPFFETIHFIPAFEFLHSLIILLPLVISLTVITSFHVVLGEQVPKVATLQAPERVALFAAVPMRIFNSVFNGFISILDSATRLVLDLIGLESSPEHISLVSGAELKKMVSGPETQGIDQPERDMISAVIDFGELVVRQVAIPRTDIIAVPATANLKTVVDTINDHDITKLPVYSDSLDHITGIIHIRDVIRVLARGQLDLYSAQDIMREALFVPETISVNDLMHQFRSSHTHMAIVLDEFSGTAGLVTLQDLLSEIIGDVRDNFDTFRPQIQMQKDGSALIEGITPLDDVNQHFRLRLANTNYDTIAGFVLDRLGHIPQEGEMVVDRINQVLIKVICMERQRIARVMLRRIS